MPSRRSLADIRPGSIDDLGDFIEILEEVGAWLWRRGIRQWEPGSNRAQRPFLERLVGTGSLITARSSRRLVGGAIITPEPTAEWAGLPGPGAIYLHKLAVSRVASGQRLGRRILAYCELGSQQEGATRMRLDCWDGNAALCEYYRSAGYSELDAVESHGYLVRLFEKTLSPSPVTG
jgi:ribosomal protein S18 acetylase RimI-like enzyme